MDKSEIAGLLKKAGDIFDGQRNALVTSRIEANKIIFVGDTHGDARITKKVFDAYSDYADMIVFLGDYVDRGKYGIENLMMIIEKLVDAPGKIIMLRGNHESPMINRNYGFMREVEEKIGEDAYKNFAIMFSHMPYAAVVNSYFCVHGGIPQILGKVEDIANLPIGDFNPDNPVAKELLWNDPNDGIRGFIPNLRGPGTYYFGPDVVEKFLAENSLKGIIRGHEVADGFKSNANGKVITVFSSTYHGMSSGILVMEGGEIKEMIKIRL